MNAPELVERLQELVDSDDERAVVIAGPATTAPTDFPYDVADVERYEDAVVITVKPRSA